MTTNDPRGAHTESDEHYLREELYDLVKSDSTIFDFLQAGSLDGLWYWDLEHPEHEWMNLRFWELLGYAAAEKRHLASEWQDLINVDDLEVALQNFRLHCEDPSHPYDQIVRYQHRSGSTVWVRCRGIAIRDAAGKAIRMLGGHTDITPQKRTEAALGQALAKAEAAASATQEAQAYAESIVATVREPLLVLDADTKVVSANRAFYQNFQVSPEETEGRLLHDLGNRQWNIPKVRELLEQVLAQNTAVEDVEVEHDFETIGRRIMLLNARRIYRETAKAQMTLLSIEDVTERRGAEEGIKKLNNELERQVKEKTRQLFQSQKLQSIGFLAGSVAHDFNNLLTVMLGHCGEMERILRSTDPLSESVAEIKACGKRAALLTRQLLAFSRRQTLQPEVLNFNDVIANMEGMLRRIIGEDVELVTVVANNLGAVNVDPGQVEQLIMNLAVNSREAMPDGGGLTIETANVHLDEAYARAHEDVVAGPHVMLAVSDTGSGMDEKTASQIFEPFFTTKKKVGGTGLGLSTVYGIVKQSRGHIEVYSEPGQGTAIKIYLPRHEGRPVAKAKQEVKAIRGRGELTLLVEDDAGIRRLVEKKLKHLGYRVTVAANGSEALILVEEQELRPDLLITDVVMLGMSGVVLVERLRRSQTSLKVIYMSGYPDDAIVRHGVLDPGQFFIQKPFDVNQLGVKIRDVLDS